MIEIIINGKDVKISNLTYLYLRLLFIKQRISTKWFRFICWYSVQKLSLSCKLWKLRGLDICEKHGFHAQSWFTGKCKECIKEDES